MNYFNDDKSLLGKRQRDADDLQNEVAGRETGRQARFLTADGGRTEAEKKRRAERVFRDALEALLATDAEYRALYEELGEALGTAESNADSVINDLNSRIAALNETISDMADKAARLPDGRRVFRYADGRVADEFGESIEPDIADGIVWPPNAPEAEDYFKAVEAKRDLESLLADWLDYRNDVLGGIRDRYDDRDNPMDKDALNKAMDDVAKLSPKTSDLAQTAPVSQAVPLSASSKTLMPTTLK